MEGFFMTRSEVCDYLGISVTRLRRLETLGALRAVRRLEGGRKLYASEDVHAYMRSIWQRPRK